MYGSETQPFTKNAESEIAVFERRFLRSIFGGIEENGLWGRRFNFEIYRIFKEPDIIKVLKLNEWIGHIMLLDWTGKSSKEGFCCKALHYSEKRKTTTTVV